MRGIKTMTGLRVLAAGHAFVQNLRRGHYEIAAEHNPATVGSWWHSATWPQQSEGFTGRPAALACGTTE
jgi:hypothetical protein